MARSRSYSATACGSIVLLIAAITVFWISFSSSPRSLQAQSDSYLLRHYVFGPNIVVRANDGNNKDPNFYPHSLNEFVDLPNEVLDSRGVAIKKGRWLDCKMNAKLADTRELQTSWTEYLELEDYGWQTNHEFDDEDIVDNIQLEDAFADLDISNDPADWVKLIQSHGEESHVDGYTYPATGAQYKNIINFKNGAMVAENNKSPRQEVTERGDLDSTRLVPLDKWSDVVWLGLEQLIDGMSHSSPDFEHKPLEHIFRFFLTNPDTRATILNIAGKSSIEDLGEWPGQSYPIEEYQALAALSTPNGYGAAWMLIQHKSKMGVRKIDRVNSFNCPEKFAGAHDPEEVEKDARMCMYFHVAGV
ncbi:hypothetical protein DOTSEDRAFT_20797 [Dothistroma septosporum NZE10]|uniref:Uncharacterized protein n=1 Tax=Dothistroma septosporum (strain NZE10 / CBS 128990) TaxID=675120 RepID=N1PX32_DOTSN|nr:hypothetical protein DOTSEDRAFT_20797 [Dothistroma septosporum NZE10]